MRPLSFDERQDLQISQAKKIRRFRQSEEYQLIFNTFMAMKKIAQEERRKTMKLQSTRENCLYFTGYEDGIQRCVDAIDQIVADGDAIEAAREEMTSLQEAI